MQVIHVVLMLLLCITFSPDQLANHETNLSIVHYIRPTLQQKLNLPTRTKAIPYMLVNKYQNLYRKFYRFIQKHFDLHYKMGYKICKDHLHLHLIFFTNTRGQMNQ